MVIVPGAGELSFDWVLVQPRVAEFTPDVVIAAIRKVVLATRPEKSKQ